jgi:hypothetical protein
VDVLHGVALAGADPTKTSFSDALRFACRWHRRDVTSHIRTYVELDLPFPSTFPLRPPCAPLVSYAHASETAGTARFTRLLLACTCMHRHAGGTAWLDTENIMSGKWGAPPHGKRARGAGGSGDEGVAEEQSDRVVAMDALPDELLLHIFVFLNTRSLLVTVSGVCTRWRALCGDTPRVRVDLSFLPWYLLLAPPDRRTMRVTTPLSSLAKALARFKHVESVRAVSAGDGIALAIASSCPRLSAVDFTDPRNLGSKRAWAYYYCLTDVGLARLAECCPLLTSVDFREGNSVSDASLVALADRCPRLTSLAVGGRQCTITIVGLQAILARCGPHLTKVHFDACFDDEAVVALAQSCPHLTTVGLRGTSTADSGLIALAQHCPRITSIDITDCGDMTDVGVITLAQHCPLLMKVYCNGCCRLTDAAMVALAERCTQLTSLHANYCRQLTDSALISLGKNCPRLKTVHFDECSLLTDLGVDALAEGCHHLTTVTLYECHRLTGVAVCAIAKHCPLLRVLQTALCPLLTDVGVLELAQHCPQLECVILAECNQLTDESVIALVKHCPRLEWLNMNGCALVTETCTEWARSRPVGACPGLFLQMPCGKVYNLSIRAFRHRRTWHPTFWGT